MLRILKNLKKTWVSLLVIIILLCVQASTDLTLPDYTSKIVNVGIQQGGIETESPEAIRESQMEKILLLSDDKEEILNSYTLISKDTLSKEEYEEKVEIYPELANQNIYLKKEGLSKKQEEDLDSSMGKLMAITYALSSNEGMTEAQGQMMNLDTMKKAMEEKLSQMSDSIITQSAIAAVKEEYKNIGMDTDKIQSNYIAKTGLQMVGIASITLTAAVLIMLLSSRVAAALGKTLREKVFEKVLSFSIKEFNEFSTASLITRTTNDVQQIQMLLTMLFRVVVYAPIIGIGGFLRVLRNGNTSMAWIIGLAIVCILFIVITLFIISMPKFQKLQKLIDKLNLVSREILTGLPVIRAFNTERREEERFQESNKDLMKANIFVNRAMSIMMPAIMFVMNGIMLLIIWTGGHSVDQGIMQVGDMMAFIQYTMQIVMSFLMISIISIMLPRAQVSAKRIMEVIESNPSIKDSENLKTIDESKKGYVEFRDVSFRYPDADKEMIEDITFTAEPGKTTAIIGSTGAGKSTIVNLIPRFYDVTGGELLIDGVNVKDLAQKDLRSRIGFVPQRGVLFFGTIESNIKYGNPDLSDEKMIEAARIAQATEFIESKPKKYKEEIAQGGSNVSGGQKQRLSIARAIAKDPEIFVFDDSFSALDLKTDRNLREALKEKTANKTVIIVAQRISTILNADQIIVLDEGKIVGKGTHKELMENCETYRQIALSQLSEDELNN